MQLDIEQTRRALGIAASQSAGLRENFGTMTKPFHPGRSAESGIVAASDEAVNRRDVKKMIEKIEFGVHPQAEAAGYEKMTTIIDIELADGRTVSGRADFGKGSPANPMSDEELAGKFRECAAWGGLPKPNAEKIVDLVFGLEHVRNIRELTRLLSITAKSKVETQRTQRTRRKTGSARTMR
jgi:2-methylcitrate dehydratase PrpD